MAYRISILTRARSLFKPPHLPVKSITTSTLLCQEPQLAATVADVPSDDTRPLPPTAIQNSNVIPLSFFPSSFPSYRLKSMSSDLDLTALKNKFADWTTLQRWDMITELFESWIQSSDQNGKRNKPDVNLYNQYLRAKLQMRASAVELLDLVERMQEFLLSPNTASYNLVLKAMWEEGSTEAAEKLLSQLR